MHEHVFGGERQQTIEQAVGLCAPGFQAGIAGKAHEVLRGDAVRIGRGLVGSQSRPHYQVAASATSSRPYGVLHGRSSRRGDQAGGVALEDLGCVRIAEPAGVRPRAAPAGEERDARGRAAAHRDRAVVDLDARGSRARSSRRTPGAQRVEHRRLRLLGGAHHRPGEAAVVAGVVRVVGGERVRGPAALERLVPVDRGVAAADLELAARVPHLDPRGRRSPPTARCAGRSSRCARGRGRRRSRRSSRRPPAAARTRSPGAPDRPRRPRASTWASSRARRTWRSARSKGSRAASASSARPSAPSGR